MPFKAIQQFKYDQLKVRKGGLPPLIAIKNQECPLKINTLDLSTWRSVEDNPYGEVLGKVLEAVLGSGSDEHNIARLECVSLAIVK
jgi:hypothetical protein